MLNCTDLACVLHHHHFYAHLHHLKHHLQDDNDNTAIGDGSDVADQDIQGLLNDTDSELSSLSHVDAPNDVIYMVCGVVIAMLLVGLIIVLVAVAISKLRKREESSSPVSVEAPEVVSSAEQHPAAPTAYGQTPVWVFPPLPPQPNIIRTCGQDAIMQYEKGGLKGGFRKQFSGRFKRLVSRRPEPAPVIPPELKPQLKSIYVY